MFAIQNGSNLFQTQSVLFNGKRTVNSADQMCIRDRIKHSEEAAPQQYRHLIDEQKCAQTEHRYGPITGKFVLYRGESQVVELSLIHI